MSQLTETPGTSAVAPNIPGNIFYGDYAFNVNTNNGTIIYHQAKPPVQLRTMFPRPPAAPLDFLDRTSEVIQIDQSIRGNKPVTLYGPEGIGKSVLLRQAANSDAAQQLPQGVLLIEGIDADGAQLGLNDVIQRLFDALYQSDPPLKVDSTTARTYLSNTRPLVILDNIRFPSPDSIRTLIDLFPQSPILLALPQPPAGNLTRLVKLSTLPHPDAVHLFAAMLNQPTGRLTRTGIDAICKLLNDVPLAVVTAANAVRDNNLPLGAALDTLNQIHPPSSDPIDIGLERAYGLTYTTLSTLEQHVLAIAAALPAASIDPDMIQRMITGDTAEPGGEIKREGDMLNVGGVRVPIRDAAHTPGTEDTQPTTVNAVSAAIDKLKSMGLLRANSPRLRIAPGLRSIAQAGVDRNGINDRLIFQLLNAVRARKYLDWQYCADELGNFLSAIDWAATQNRWNEVILLGRAIDPYLTLHGLWDAWRKVLDRILQAAQSLHDQGTEGWALHQIGTYTIGPGDKAGAIKILRQALSLRQALGDTVGEAYTQHNLDMLILPPPTDRGRERSGSRPPGSGLSTAAKLIIGGAIAIAAAAIILPRVLQPAATITPAPTNIATQQIIVPTQRPTIAPQPTITPRPPDTPTPVPTPAAWPLVFFSGADYKSGYEIFTINSDGSNRTQITKGLPEFAHGPCTFRTGAAILSPNGKQIAYTQYTYNSDFVVTSLLYLMNADGSDVNAVAKAQGYISRPSWSPDGTLVAVGVSANQGTSIQIFDHNGRQQSTIGLKSSGFAPSYFQLSWSPDSKRIVFSDGDNVSNLFATNVDGSDQRQITDEAGGAYLPAWSPDGKRIAYLTTSDAGWEIHVIGSDGGSPVTSFPAEFDFTEFAWSPDSTSLAFSTDSSDEQSISIANIESGKVTRLVDRLGTVVGPIWSPDGRQIAFTSFDTKSFDDIFGNFSITGGPVRSDIYMINADGSGLMNLTNAPRDDDFTAYPLICAQCPYVYTYDVGQQNWNYDTTILYKLAGKQSETLQTRALSNFDGRLLIREVEPETSYIDQLYVLVTDDNGQVIQLSAQIDQLRAADGDYLVTHTGDELLLTFDGFDQIHSPQQVSVVAKGYYVPLHSSSAAVP